MMLQRVVLASGNLGKLREMGALLGPLGIELTPQALLGIGEAEEPFPTFIENAIAKARHAARVSGLPALADDSGICVDALGGAPGVRSARFSSMAGGPSGDDANNARLLRELAGRAERGAAYVCALALLRSADDPCPVLAEGVWRGEIIDVPRGRGGFGYDPYFLLPALGLTAAELDREHKNALSHRGIAMRRLVDGLRERGLV